MGHDMPPELYERFADAVLENARRGGMAAPARAESHAPA